MQKWQSNYYITHQHKYPLVNYYSDLKLKQLINNSNHSKLQPGVISTITKLCINRRKTNSTIRKIKKLQSKQE